MRQNQIYKNLYKSTIIYTLTLFVPELAYIIKIVRCWLNFALTMHNLTLGCINGRLNTKALRCGLLSILLVSLTKRASKKTRIEFRTAVRKY